MIGWTLVYKGYIAVTGIEWFVDLFGYQVQILFSGLHGEILKEWLENKFDLSFIEPDRSRNLLSFHCLYEELQSAQ